MLLMPPVLALLDEPQRREAMAALVEQTDDLNRQNGDFFDDEAWNQLKDWVNRYYPDADG